LLTPKSLLKPLPAPPPGVERRIYEGDTAQPLKPQLLSFALLLLFADVMAVLLLQVGGQVARLALRRPARLSALLLLAAAPASAPLPPVAGWAHAQSAAPAGRAREPDARAAIQATGKVSFAYVLSGDAATDEASRQGLIGLGKFLVARTAVEPGEPFAVNI